MQSSTVRIPPLRLAFLTKPSAKAALQHIFEVNSGLWGGLYNFIIPSIKTLPKLYYEPYLNRQRSPASVMNGMIEGIQPDFLVEMEPGMAHGLKFPSSRVINVQQLTGRDNDNRARYGIDKANKARRSTCRNWRNIQQQG